MDNMENINSNSKKSKASIIAVILSIILVIILIIGAIFWGKLTTKFEPNTIRDGVLYLNHEEIYVYDSLESALTDTKGEDGPPKPLKEFLPEILAEEKLVYLEGTTVGICVDQQITQEEIPDVEGKEDRVIYKIGDYFLAESIPGE